MQPLYRMQGSKSAEIYIYDIIGDDFWGDGITAKNVARALRDLGNVDTITVRINSPGGVVSDGNAIYNALNRHEARIIVEVDALAASAASVIAMAGDEIRMAKNALMMIHNASGMTRGEAKDHEKTAEVLRKISESAADIYAARTGRTKDEILGWMDEETWMTADEAVERGFASEVIEAKQKPADAPSQRWKPELLAQTVNHEPPGRVRAQLAELGLVVPAPSLVDRGGRSWTSASLTMEPPGPRTGISLTTEPPRAPARGARSASVPTALGRLAAEPRARLGDLKG